MHAKGTGIDTRILHLFVPIEFLPARNCDFFSLQNNPADFSFFFDTSRRRTCYIAPERFQPFQELATTGGLSGRSQVLTHGMDIFSLG